MAGPASSPRSRPSTLGASCFLASGSVKGAEVPLQVLGLVVVREEVVLVDVVLVIVLVPLGDVLFIVLVVLILRLLATLLTRVVVVVRVSGLRRSVRLRPEAENSLLFLFTNGI